MKIVYLYTALSTIGGADRIIIQKANYLAEKMKHEVYIITDSQGKHPVIFPLSTKVKHIDLNINFGKQYSHGFILRGYYYFTLMYVYQRRLSKLLKLIKADIVISTLGRDMDFLPQLNDGSIKIGESHISKPFCRNLHLLERRGFPYKQIAHYWRKKLENRVRKLDALIVLTKHDADKWKPIKDAYVIPNSLPFFPQQGSTCKEKKIISVGRFNEQKGYDRLIQAWGKVCQKHNEWNLYIYGEGEDQAMLEKLIKENEITNRVKLCSPVSDIQSKYLESSIYVMSSHFEGLPMVLLEAMACGIPCISFDCPYGPAEIIKNGDDGILIENGNIEKLTEAICYLIENEDKRIFMGKQARINIQRYTKEPIMKQWENLFKSLMKNKP